MAAKAATSAVKKAQGIANPILGVSPGAGGNLTHSPSNDNRWDMLNELTQTLGTQSGLGADVQIKFMLAVTDAAYGGVVDLSENKHGDGMDDATYLTDVYFKARRESNVFDHKSNAGRKAISLTRTCIKLGSWSKGGNGEPIGTVNKLMSIRAKYRKDPSQAKNLKDAASTLIDYARAQLKLDTLIDDEGLDALVFKNPKNESTVEDVLDSMRKTLKKIYDGKHSAGGRQTAGVKHAMDKVNHELKIIADERKSAIAHNNNAVSVQEDDTDTTTATQQPDAVVAA